MHLLECRSMHRRSSSRFHRSRVRAEPQRRRTPQQGEWPRCIVVRGSYRWQCNNVEPRAGFLRTRARRFRHCVHHQRSDHFEDRFVAPELLLAPRTPGTVRLTMRWFRTLATIIRNDPNVYSRGRWYALGGIFSVAPFLIIGVGILVTDPSPLGIVVGGLISIAGITGLLVAADHVEIDEKTVMNVRVMPRGSRTHQRADIIGVGWARQSHGFTAPVLITRSGHQAVLTALGQQTMNRPARTARWLAEHLGVDCVGELPRVGLRSQRS